MPMVKNPLTGQMEWVESQEYLQRMQDAVNPPKARPIQEDMSDQPSDMPEEKLNMADFINSQQESAGADEVGYVINEPPKPKFNRVKSLMKK
jgi:hypothetical protein